MLASLARQLARATPNWLLSRLWLARSNLTPTWPLQLRSGQRSYVQPTLSQNSAPIIGLGSRTVPQACGCVLNPLLLNQQTLATMFRKSLVRQEKTLAAPRSINTEA